MSRNIENELASELRRDYLLLNSHKEKETNTATNDLLSVSSNRNGLSCFRDEPLKRNIYEYQPLLRNRQSTPEDKLTFYKELRRKINAPENQDTTEQLYYKIRLDELNCSALVLISIISAVANRHIIYSDSQHVNPNYQTIADFCLIFVSISNIMFSKQSNN